MKKNILFFLTFVLFSILSHAQSIGIGNSIFTPLNMLDVKGSMSIGTGYAGTNPAPVNGLLIEGNTGIGLINPGYKLDVNGVIRNNSDVISTSANTFRSIFGNYGIFDRNDGADFYTLLTNAGDQYGSWNGLRPFRINLSSGDVYINCNSTSFFSRSSDGNVGIGTTNPNTSAKLDVSATNKGLLIPNVALTATNAAGPITSPATSLLVYNTATAGTVPYAVTPGYYYNAGTPAAPNWMKITAGGGSSSFQYENRFYPDGGAACSSMYYFNSSNFGPGTYGAGTDYCNDWEYCTATPGSIPAYHVTWYTSYTATAPMYFTGFNGWAMIEDNYDGDVNENLYYGTTTVSIYFYKYSPTSGNTGNVSGTLCGSASVGISRTFVPSAISFACTPVLLNAGDVIIGYCKVSNCPYESESWDGYLSIVNVMGAMQF